MAAPWLNEALLRDLAQLSQGKYWRWNAVDQLAEAVPDQREEVELRRPPEPLWDRGWLLALVVGLLATEWGVRKWRRLL
jgi:hypothetical protein